MKPPKSKMAELSPNATGGGKFHAETAESAEFKMTELGPIPVDWEVKRLGDLFELSAAGDLQTECSSRIKTDINIHPIYSNGLEDAGLYGYTSKPRYRADSITITGRGTLGHAEYRTLDFDAIIRLIVMRPSRRLDGRYVAFQINYSNPFHFEITSIPQLTVPQVSQALILLPPLAEQRRIAGALSDVDELISALGKLIEKKRNIKTGAMQELLTGKTRLPGFGNPETQSLCASVLKKDTEFEDLDFNTETQRHEVTEFKMTELGPIPKDWEVKRLGDVANILDNRRVPLSESQRKSGAFPYCGANGIVDYIDRYEFDEEAVLIAEDGGNFADFATRPIAYKMSGKYWVNNHAHVLTVKACCDLDYLFSYLSHKDITDIISGGTRAKLTRAQLENIIISLPPLAEQQAIAAVLSDIDAEIAALEADRAKYESIKQGMMQELLTGKTRLKGE